MRIEVVVIRHIYFWCTGGMAEDGCSCGCFSSVCLSSARLFCHQGGQISSRFWALDCHLIWREKLAWPWLSWFDCYRGWHSGCAFGSVSGNCRPLGCWRVASRMSSWNSSCCCFSMTIQILCWTSNFFWPSQSSTRWLCTSISRGEILTFSLPFQGYLGLLYYSELCWCHEFWLWTCLGYHWEEWCQGLRRVTERNHWEGVWDWSWF